MIDVLSHVFFRCYLNLLTISWSGPTSSYSALDTHNWWNVPNEDRIDPPIHEAYFRSVVLPAE